MTKLFTQSLSKFCCQTQSSKPNTFFVFPCRSSPSPQISISFPLCSFSSSLLSLSPSLLLVLNVQRMPRRKAHTINMTQYSPFLLSLDPSFWDFNETCKVKVKHKSEDERGHQTGYHFKDISITKGVFFFFFLPYFWMFSSKTLSPYIGLSQSLPNLNP